MISVNNLELLKIALLNAYTTIESKQLEILIISFQNLFIYGLMDSSTPFINENK